MRPCRSRYGRMLTCTNHRRATEDSTLAIQIFDQKKFKKKDQGFLGVINIRVGDVIDLQVGGDGNIIHSIMMQVLTQCMKKCLQET